jgi:aerobic C4-dicarboxylate transport protein
MTTTAATQPDLADVHPAMAAQRPFWKKLGFQVVVSMVLGIIVGLVWPDFATSLKILGDIFLRLIKTAVAPLVFLTVAVGIVAAGDVKRVGKVGLIAMVYFEILSTIALALGLVFGNLVGVGKNMGPRRRTGGGDKGGGSCGKGRRLLPYHLRSIPAQRLSRQLHRSFRARRVAPGARDCDYFRPWPDGA